MSLATFSYFGHVKLPSLFFPLQFYLMFNLRRPVRPLIRFIFQIFKINSFFICSRYMCKAIPT